MLSILSGILIAVILFFLLPTLEEPRRKFLTWIKRRPHISSKKMEELRILEEIIPGLLKINSIPSFPDKLKASDISDILNDIGNKARKLEFKEFIELREKLIKYSSHSMALLASMNSEEILNKLGKSTAFALVKEIRARIEGVMNKKKKGARDMNKDKKLHVGKDSVVIGDVSGDVGDGSVVIGPTDNRGNVILNQTMAVGRNAHAGLDSIAIGAGAGAGSDIILVFNELRRIIESSGDTSLLGKFRELIKELNKEKKDIPKIKMLWEAIKAAAALKGAMDFVSKVSSFIDSIHLF